MKAMYVTIFLVLATLAWVLAGAIKEKNACHERGGVYISQGGAGCVKLEKLP